MSESEGAIEPSGDSAGDSAGESAGEPNGEPTGDAEDVGPLTPKFMP